MNCIWEMGWEMDIKTKVMSIMDNLDPITRQEIAMMYAPISDKDMLPRVKKLFVVIQKLNEEEKDQLLKLIYNDNEMQSWQQQTPPEEELIS